MPECEHFEICGLDAEENTEEDLCILHSQDPEKNKEEFDEALAAHRKKHGHNFRFFVFPRLTNFSGATFDTKADFYGATFTVSADFSNATFAKGANFILAKFHGTATDNFTYAKFNDGAHFSKVNFPNGARFTGVEFSGLVDFSDGEFAKQADFSTAKFYGPVGFFGANFWEAKFESTSFAKEADLFGATFNARANFFQARFGEGADFSDASFAQGVDFSQSVFLGITRFMPWKQEGMAPSLILSGAEVDFRDVIVEPLDALIFRNADLQKCRFLHTDLRKAQFTNVKWPRKSRRFRVYDEDVELPKGDAREWPHIERLYRELKQNYEDRRDYGRAGDFHYGEKEMRRRNPDTPRWLSCLLRLYRCVGGYGERGSPPFVWSIGLFVVCAGLYLCFGLRPKDLCSTPALTSVWGYFDYSLRVMTLLKPDDLVPIGCARYVTTFESLAGPILLGLFALALRQRLKR